MRVPFGFAVLFVIAGALSCYINGWIVEMASFDWQQYRDLSLEQKDDVDASVAKVHRMWAFFGGAAGLICYVFLATSPFRDYCEQVQCGPGILLNKATFKTMGLAILIGGIGGFLLCKYYVPSISLPAGVNVRPGNGRVVLGTFLTVMATLVTSSVSMIVMPIQDDRHSVNRK